MRLAIDARALGPHFPGIGRAILGLLTGLQMVEHDLDIVVVHQPAHRALIESTGIGGDPHFRLLPLPVDPLGLDQQWRVPGVARAIRADVWHAPYYFRPFAGLPPTVVTVFDVIGPGLDPSAPAQRRRLRPRQIIWELAMRLSMATAAQVVTASHSARHDLLGRYRLSDERLTVVPLAPDRRFSPPSTSAVDQVRQRYGLPSHYVLYLGSNKPHKNLVALVEAWGLLKQRDGGPDDPALVIAGREDPRYASARQRCTELGLNSSVRFVPDVPDDDLPPLLGNAICFVFPSIYEGFGLPPLEAMASGTPVVAANRTSLPEVVDDAGLLVDPDPASLAAGIRRLLDNAMLRETLRQRGLERAAAFSWQRTATEMLRVYRQARG